MWDYRFDAYSLSEWGWRIGWTGGKKSAQTACTTAKSNSETPENVAPNFV